MQEMIHIYYTNDLHSNFDQWPQVNGFFKDKQMNHEAAGETMWRVDIGDHVDRVHPISEATMGKANIQLLNEADYDVVTLGNNEGITMSHQHLVDLYTDALFDVVCANLTSQTSTSPLWLQTSVHKQSIQGTTVGFIGLTAPFNDFYELLDWHVASPFAALDTYIEQLQAESDIVVLLSHLGIHTDREIARRYDIDVIIGGHTHHLLRTGEVVDGTLITAAGKHCHFAGHVQLTWDHYTGTLASKEANTIDISHMAKDMPTAMRLNQLSDQAHQTLSVPIGYIPYRLKARWFTHTELMQRLTDTLLKWTEADVAMLNAGLILDDLPEGDVTYEMIHTVCPHPINPCVVVLTGDQLLSVIDRSLGTSFTEIKLKGFGFRGEVIGDMVYSGIELETSKSPDGENILKHATLNDRPIHADKTYYLATADTFTFGSLLPEVANSNTKIFYLPELLRDLLVHTLRTDDSGSNTF